MRTLFFEFPKDKVSWNIEDEHMLGRKYLVAPIFEFGKRRKQVYLPFGSRWKDVNMALLEVAEYGLIVRHL